MSDLFDLNERERAVIAEAREILTRFLSDQPVLSSYSAVIDYLTVEIGASDVEQFRILFLDSKNRLIVNWAAGAGTLNHVSVYPREVVRKALEVNAASMIISHNHPSGDPTPSHSDLDMTKQIVAAAATMGIIVHDHIIVTAGQDYSLRANGHFGD